MRADAGIDRKMLESYDRPIVTDPQFFADKKNSLIGEFENYLKILKSVSCWTRESQGSIKQLDRACALLRSWPTVPPLPLSAP